MGQDGRRRLSWREIDRLKDQSGLSRIRKKLERENRNSYREDPRAKERYLKELEKLFTDKKELEKQNFLEKLHKSYGSKSFKKLAKEYIEKYGIPEDWSTLMLFLDLEEKDVVFSVLEKIKEEFPKRSFSEKQGIISKLKTIALSAKDESIGFRVERLLKELSG
ncbi:MAG: hypothetical protein GXO57_08110 [Thermodesulfobacteria bacterium]|nr:hypothetical protein [Thermodesulfobacteriota bacterium]